MYQNKLHVKYIRAGSSGKTASDLIYILLVGARGMGTILYWIS